MSCKIVIGVILSSLIVWAEPSVYSGHSSYGNSKQVKRNKTAIYRLRQEVARLREDIDGLRSIIEGLNSQIRRLNSAHGDTGADAAALNDMAVLLDKINQNYVTRGELDKILQSSNKKPPTTTKPKPTKPNTQLVIHKPKEKIHKPTQKIVAKPEDWKHKPKSAIYSKGVRLFGKKRYTAAKERFEYLVDKHFKRASSYFYLGEIAYKTAKYDDAVEYYKKSAELNDGARYMDKLLLHTGFSLEKNGHTDQAKGFFEAIVDGYPDTPSAKIAREHL